MKHHEKRRFGPISGRSQAKKVQDEPRFPPKDYRDFDADVAVMIAVSAFVAIVSILLLNILIAQLNQSYHEVFEDMQAHLNRAPGSSRDHIF